MEKHGLRYPFKQYEKVERDSTLFSQQEEKVKFLLSELGLEYENEHEQREYTAKRRNADVQEEEILQKEGQESDQSLQTPPVSPIQELRDRLSRISYPRIPVYWRRSTDDECICNERR